MKQAGLVVAETVMEHKDLIKTFALLNDFAVSGNRVAIIANAGYEKTYAADHLGHLEVAVFDPPTEQALKRIIPPFVGVDPLLDLTPMADDALFEQCIDIVLGCGSVDGLFVSIVPQTPALHTTDEEMAADPENVAARIVRQMKKHRKPIAVSICITAGADVVYNSLGRTPRTGRRPHLPVRKPGHDLLERFYPLPHDPGRRGPFGVAKVASGKTNEKPAAGVSSLREDTTERTVSNDCVTFEMRLSKYETNSKDRNRKTVSLLPLTDGPELIEPAIHYTNSVMPDLIRHPVSVWIPAFAGMTTVCIFNCRVNKYGLNS